MLASRRTRLRARLRARALSDPACADRPCPACGRRPTVARGRPRRGAWAAAGPGGRQTSAPPCPPTRGPGSRAPRGGRPAGPSTLGGARPAGEPTYRRAGRCELGPPEKVETRKPARAGQRPRAQRQTYVTGNELEPGERCDELPRARPCCVCHAHTIGAVLGRSQGRDDGPGPSSAHARRACRAASVVGFEPMAVGRSERMPEHVSQRDASRWSPAAPLGQRHDPSERRVASHEAPGVRDAAIDTSGRTPRRRRGPESFWRRCAEWQPASRDQPSNRRRCRSGAERTR